MKSRLFIRNLIFIVVLVFLTALSGTVWPRENVVIGNPIGPATVPPSSIRSGLIRSPNRLDNNGNLIITGSVRGGKHFRGVVPYDATWDFGTSVPSSSFDSFLRYSASWEDFGRSTRSYQPEPYYSPTQTVTTTRPGRDVFRPPTTRAGRRAGVPQVEVPRAEVPADSFPLGAVPRQQSLSSPAASAAIRLQGLQTRRGRLGELRPMSRTPRELEKMISDEVGKYQQESALSRVSGRRLTTEQYPGRMEETPDAVRSVWDREQFQRELQQMKQKAAELKQSLKEQDSLRPFEKTERGKRTKQFEQQASEERTKEMPTWPFGEDRFTAAKMAEQITRSGKLDREGLETLAALQSLQQSGTAKQREDFRKAGTQLDVYEQVRQRLNDLRGVAPQKGLEDRPDARQRASELEQSPAVEDLLLSAEGSGELDEEALDAAVLRELQARANSRNRSAALVELRGLPEGTLSARAKRILGGHENIASFSEDKFNRYFTAAELYLKQGRYYRAVDAYSLASLYKRDDPLALAGRSHALFAAGEYMSSSLFLSRALKIFPEYAWSKINLAGMLGGRDRLDGRIANVKECLKISGGAPELHFLLGYVYYQMGRVGEAKKAIDAAYERMPDSPAVGAVKKAIYDAMALPGTK